MTHRLLPDDPVGVRLRPLHRRLTGSLRPSVWAAGLGLLAVCAYAAVLALGMARSTYDVWGALVVGPCLALVSWPLLTAALRAEDDGWIRRLIVTAFGLKVAGALARWGVAFVLYEGSADAARYDQAGAALAAQFRAGFFEVAVGEDGLVGTRYLELLTGIVYTITGPTLLGGYLVFAWMGFWGLYFFYRAFRIALPWADHRRYGLLIFLLPSLLFWPSGMGKEAWMCLCLGLATLGAARLVTGARGAGLPLALGFVGTAMVRPHMTAIVFVAAVTGFLFRRDAHRTLLTPVIRILTLGALAAVGMLIASRAGAFFDLDEVSAESVGTVLTDTHDRTLGGGSDFVAEPVQSAADMPGAVLTVLFRPFPWEAVNLQALATAVEGTLLLAFALASWGRLRNIWRYREARPYIVMCLAYLTFFVYAFSTFNNFGLLARQRSLVYPFLLALLCLPTVAELRRRRGSSVRPPAREAIPR